MPYRLKLPESSVLKSGQFVNAHKVTHCVMFVQQAAGAPETRYWKRGIKVQTAEPGTIRRGTVIATFDDGGKYPTDGLGQHAAVYLSHNKDGIRVLDQWASQGAVRPRTIGFKNLDGTRRSNDGSTFYVVD